ncbi:MAG: tetC 2 [Frankiales bacterium]|nr:tetC 2 [Frankiales bacterium]
MVSGIRQARALETRARIMQAARELFSDPGYHATGTAEIVQAAGVGTRGALYHHFADKRQLFIAVLEEVTAELVADSEARRSGMSGVQAVQTTMETYFDRSLDPGIRRIVLLDGPAVLGWELYRDLALDYGLRALRGLIDAGVADGSLVVPDAEVMAHLLLSVSDAAAQFIAHAEDPRSARVQSGRSVAALLAGLVAPSAEPHPVRP